MERRVQTVSVIIPCYNASRFLRETLDSALAQTHPPLEILVIDDGSTDDSADIARSYGPPVRVISQPNQGESVARNRGIDEAQGEWIAFLDADDLWAPEKLERQLAAVDSEDVVCVHTNLYYFGDRSGQTHLEEYAPHERYEVAHLAAYNAFVSPSAMLVRTGTSPRFPTWTAHGEDLIYCLELVTRGRVQLLEEPLTGYRKHATAQSNSAATRIGWHQSMREWLRSYQSGLSSHACEMIDHHCLAELANYAWKYKASRNWSEYWKVRRYLQEHGHGVAEVDLLLRNRVYPKWAYSLLDWLRRGTTKPALATG